MNDFFSSPSVPGNDDIISRLQAISNAFVAITSELDLDVVLQKIADTAREVGKAHYAAMGVVDENGKITSFITSGITKEQRELLGEPPQGHGLLGLLITEGQPLRVPNIAEHPRSCGFPPNHPPMTSLLGVPVSVQGRVTGDLYLTDKIGSVAFTPEDEWWLTIFARQAAIAIENAHLYKKARIAQQRSQTMAELTSQLNQSSQPEELFQHITRAACTLLELPAAALYLLNQSGSRFDFEAEVGLRNLSQHSLDNALPIHGSAAGEVLEKGLPVIIEDKAELEIMGFIQLENGEQPRSMLMVPIRRGTLVKGVIAVYGSRPRRFSAEEETILQAFADQAALALEKARLYQQKEEFLSMTAHDLRAPLTAIKMSAGLLEVSLPSDLPAPLKQLVSNIGRNSERLNTMLEDLLDFSRLEQGRVVLNLERLELTEALSSAVSALAPLFEEKNQQIELKHTGGKFWVLADRNRLEQALVNLLTNANKYTPESGRVETAFMHETGWVTVEITDSGPGIPKEEQNLIFNRYYRRSVHDQSRLTTGSGLGLPIARSLVELHKGQLWVESEPGQGSTFKLRLPIAE
jgi:signal transduction histidine kinase